MHNKLKFAFSRILFPPLILWDTLKFTINSLAGEAVGKLIVIDSSVKDANPLINLSATLNVEKITTTAADGVKLNALIIGDNNNAIPRNQQQYIIYFQGRGRRYDTVNNINEMQEDALHLGCNVMAFNYRGIGDNTNTIKAKSKSDIVKDGIAQVNYLLNQGVSPNNITLKGYSLGGGVATLVTKHFYDHGKGISLSLFNDRSFSTITNYMVGQTRSRLDHHRHTGHVEPFLNKLLGWISKPFLKLALVVTGWEINAAKAYKSLPNEHKDYIVIKSSRERRIQNGDNLIDDSTITDYASLHAALRPERRKEKAAASNKTILLKIKARLSAHKMCAEDNKLNTNAHILPDKEIRNRYQDQTGQGYFWSFFQRIHHSENVGSQERNDETQSNVINAYPW